MVAVLLMKKSTTSLLAKILISLTLIVVLYSRIDFAGLRSRLADLRVLPLAAFFVLLLFNTAISSLKWRVLLKADAIDIPFGKLLVSYIIGTFFNVFLPSNIGGDAYRIYDISQRSAKPVNTFASVFADRLSGFIALAAFGLVFPLVGCGLIDERRVLILPLGLFGLLAVIVWSLYQQTLLRRVLNLPVLRRLSRIQNLADKFLASITEYRKRPRLLAVVMGVSFLFQFTVIVAVYLLSRSLCLDVPFFYFCIFVPLISLLEAVPLSIYGIGLRDSGYVFFMMQIGRSAEDAAAMSLLYVAVTLVYSSLGGIIFMFRARARG